MTEHKHTLTSYENHGFESHNDSPMPILPPQYQETSNASDIVHFKDPCPGENKTVYQSTQHIAYNMQSIPIAGMKIADAENIYSKVNRPPSTRPPVNNNVRPITGKLY